MCYVDHWGKVGGGRGGRRRGARAKGMLAPSKIMGGGAGPPVPTPM